MNYFRHILCPVLLGSFIGAVCADEDPIARAGATQLSAAEVAASISHLSAEEKASLLSDQETMSQIVRSLLVQQLVVKEASAKGWDKEPAIIEHLARVRESTIAETYLNSLSAPPADYPGEAEVKAAYETNKASFFVPKSFRLAQIYVDTKPGEKEAEAALGKVTEALKAPNANFADIAKQHSQEPESASRGGEIGWLTEAQIQPEILIKLPELKLNTVSPPIKLNDGWHILKVIDIKEANTPTLEQVKVQLVQQLRTAKTKANSDAYLAGLLKSNPIAINELALPKALASKVK